MRAFLLPAAALLFVGAAPATASVLTLGSSFAESCYQAAESRDARRPSMDACNRALEGEALPVHDVIGTHVNRGILWMISENFARANRDFDEALRMNPEQPEAWLNKAIARFKQGDSRTALEMADKSLSLGTRKPALAHFVRGLAHEDAGNVKAAYADLVRARDLAPKWHEPQRELARYQVR